MTDTLKQTPEQLKLLNEIVNYITTIINKNIILLRQKEVIQWLIGDLSFLPGIEEQKSKSKNGKARKILEDNWGKKVLKLKRPDLKLDGQWTNKFGEHLLEEIYEIQNIKFKKPMNKNNHQPDLEVDECVLEAKAETYFTEGTAGEKILGVPFKYRNIPELYKKPLKIYCLGGAEKSCREQYGILDGPKMDKEAKEMLDFWKKKKIEYIGMSDALKDLIKKKEETNTKEKEGKTDKKDKTDKTDKTDKKEKKEKTDKTDKKEKEDDEDKETDLLTNIMKTIEIK
jgi:hypothetical protein